MIIQNGLTRIFVYIILKDMYIIIAKYVYIKCIYD